ncbi:7980_t:CDS:2, partial [Racocetra persica]
AIDMDSSRQSFEEVAFDMNSPKQSFEEAVIDIDSLRQDFEEISINKDHVTSKVDKLYVRKSFISWEEDVKKHIFLCQHARTFISNKKVASENQRNTESCKTFLKDESLESYSWSLRMLVQATHLSPPIMIIDTDPAMDAAIAQTYPLT